MAKYRCTVCNWIYDDNKEKIKFEDLPESYTCPICGAPKSAFVAVNEGEKVPDHEDENATNVADKIVEQLYEYGVRYIYGIPGDSNLPMIEAIRKNGKIRFILTRHEETAAFMASAHGKMTDELGVCVSIAGPGSTNLITGLIDASSDGAPVLALTGQVPEIYLGSESFQEIDQIELFHPFTKFAETVAQANHAIKLTTRACQFAYDKRGVSVLSTPTDVLGQALNDKIHPKEKKLFKEVTVPADSDLKKAAELINSSKSVSILAGWGARHAEKALLSIAEKIKAPIATTSRAKGVINETDKHCVGVLGSIGSQHAAESIKNCETLLIIGSGFRQANLVRPEMKIIQIDIEPTRIGKIFEVEAGLIGDAKLILEELLPLVTEKNEADTCLAHVQKEEFLADLQKDAEDLSTPINPGYVIQALKRHIDKDAIITVDTGDHTYWFYKKFICEGQKTYLSANQASMAFALPAALSAKLDFPDKQVVGIAGDGGFAMLMADFTTAVREQLAIKMIVFNDGKLKNIKKEQDRDSYPEYGVNFPNPNFAEFATGCGGEGYRVEDPNELDDILTKAFASDKPAIVEVIIDPDKMAPATKKIE